MITQFYFLGPLLVVIIACFFIRKANWRSGRFELFENKSLYSIVIACSIFVGVNYNLSYQLFCNPVSWTYWILGPVCMWLVFFPFLLDNKSLRPVNSFFYGLSLFVLVYILLFGGFPYLIMLIVVGTVGLPVYILSMWVRERNRGFYFDWMNFYAFTFATPLYLFYVLLSHRKQFNKAIMLLPILLILSFSFYSTKRMNEIEDEYMKFRLTEERIVELKEDPVDCYYLELFLGLHWKYHTRLVVVDGWRPPFHDPVVGVRRMLNLGRSSDMNYTYFLQLQADYERIFPENKIDYGCRCAKNMVWIN